MENILPWTLALIETTPERWTRLVELLPDALLRQRPAPGEWSAVECLHHLLATEAVLFFRLGAFLEDYAAFPAYDPEAPENRIDPKTTPQELAREYARRRAASIDALMRLTPQDLKRSSRHAELGPVTLGEMVHEWAAHDLNHTVQAERALMQPFLRGCGPWQKYFSDHFIDTQAGA